MMTKEEILNCVERDDYCSTEKQLAKSHLEALAKIAELEGKVERVRKAWFAILDADKWREGMDKAMKELGEE